MHISILSYQKGDTLFGDPYLLPPDTIANVDAKTQRRLVKQLVLTAINARDHASAFGAFRDG